MMTNGENQGDEPASPLTLLPGVAEHLGALATSTDRVDPQHREAAGRLSAWLAQNREPGRTLDVVVVCTGNSRRSMLGAMMGNAAASGSAAPSRAT